MRDIFVLVFLLLESIEDIKTQTLDVFKLSVFGGLALLLELVYVRDSPKAILLGAVFGIITLIICRITREAIGYGDGVVMVIMGICCGFMKTIQTFVFAVFIMILIAVVVMTKKGIRFDARIPFIPCLFVGYLGGMFL